MEGEDDFRKMVLGYKRQEMPLFGRRLLKLGDIIWEEVAQIRRQGE